MISLVHTVAIVAALVSVGVYGSQNVFEGRYPKHLQALELLQLQKLSIDGKLDDEAWQRAKFQNREFVDITKHADKALNQLIPSMFQVEVATLYDDEYLYVGARVFEPFPYGVITGHNIQAPYHDNDFEVFIDVSGTTQYYKEFEMNILNATYDVNWGVPDGDGLSCDKSPEHSRSYVPVCVNTSFPGYSGNWSMKSDDSAYVGLQTATNYDQKKFGVYKVDNFWTLEIAFPITGSQHHGGLMDKDVGLSFPRSKFHPAFYDPTAKKNIPLYWMIDFARAEHPRKYTNIKSETSIFCPFNCSTIEAEKYNVSLLNPDGEDCKYLQKRFPTLLGNDPVYGCYFEWVYQNLGQNAYMHRPLEWAFLEFVPRKYDGAKLCKNVEFIGRHAIKLIHQAESLYFLKNNESYTNDFSTLLQYCGTPVDCADMQLINSRKDVFPSGVHINVTKNISVFNHNCTTRPCFQAAIYVSAPVTSGGSTDYIVTITSNLLVQIEHSQHHDTVRDGTRLCLP